MDEFQGPKTIQKVGSDCPVVTVVNPDYIWIKSEPASPTTQYNASLRLQLTSMRESEIRRRKWEQDHLPYGDDEYDR